MVAINQFFGTRPLLDLQPHLQLLGRGYFVLSVTNPNQAGIHLFRYYVLGQKGYDLSLPGEGPSEQLNSFIASEQRVEFDLMIDENKWLFLVIRWRRLSGLHLFGFIPLLVIMSPQRLAALSQTKRR